MVKDDALSKVGVLIVMPWDNCGATSKTHSIIASLMNGLKTLLEHCAWELGTE